MYTFFKHPHPVNFEFVTGRKAGRYVAGKRRLSVGFEHVSGGVYHLTANDRSAWSGYEANPHSEVRRPDIGEDADSGCSMRLSASAGISIVNKAGRPVIKTVEKKSLGVCGKAWILCFERNPSMEFFGMGEKSTPMEKGGRTHQFWNVDAFFDHQTSGIDRNHYDPDYISVPYVVVKQGDEYVGILIDNPYGSVISTEEEDCFYLGAENGRPSVYLIYGPTLEELTRKLTMLVGTSPLPPLWALGFHQCRWGYKSRGDLMSQAKAAEKHSFPLDGLWLDIDYMDGFRVFTFDKKHFPSPAKDIAHLQKRGYHVVPIIDPGLKREKGFRHYDSGKKADVFCKTSQGHDFVGFVWPGDTVFPDFSLARCRKWWAERVAEFGRLGIQGAWLDMNDPSTGAVDCMEMRFDNGRLDHDAHHNTYASLMAKASREGFETAWPGKRIFLICRSGYTGSQKHTAHWTGDNCSNYFHLAMAIPKCLNLAISGYSLTAPDVGGFGNDASDQLIIDWTKACCLFPFLRNHTATGTAAQEPWSRTARVLRITRHFTRLRYKLLPYIYNLLVRHESSGEAFLRPLMYEFQDRGKQRLSRIDDQFMVGPWIMQAPFVEENQTRRDVVLPDTNWYDTTRGAWVKGKHTLHAAKSDAATPLYIRDGAIIPMQKGIRTNNRNDLSDIELLVCLSGTGVKTTCYTYVYDDGDSFAYRKGIRSAYFIEASVRGDKMTVTINTLSQRAGAVRFVPVTLRQFKELRIVTESGSGSLRATKKSVSHFGKQTTWYYWR